MSDSKNGASANVSSLVNKIGRIAEKLDNLKSQVHVWSVQNKVVGCGSSFDLNTFMSTPGRKSSKAKARSKFYSVQPKWSSLEPSQQFEVLHNVATEHTRVALNFESLQRAILTAQRAVALKRELSLEKGGGDERDPEEIEFIQDLLDEQMDLTERILDAEEERLQAELDLIGAKLELVKEFSISREVYAGLLDDCETEEEMRPSRKKDSDSTKVDEKKATLKVEEDRLNEMRFLIQKLMAAMPNGGQTFDEETNKRHKAMLIRCGEHASDLRGDE